MANLILAAAFMVLTGLNMATAYPCNQDRLIQCAGSLRVLSDNQEFGFAAKKEDLDLICPDLNAGLRCIDEYTRKCMAPHQRSHFNKLYAGSSMVIQEICQEGPYQDEFLRHASCMWEVKQDYEECARDYQHKLQELSGLMSNDTSEGDTERHVRRLCCSFQEYLRCSHAIVMDTCGEETATFTKGFLDRMASSLIQVHCEKYPSGSQICEEDISAASLSSVSSSLLLASLALVFLLVHRT
ncbi:uncharacterized protein LOC128998600 [Macrosteles quadrilineatus]|uniref:uncharacterized protein LOC128998600 n=1 Tax=Macrosteles quadrilineatus TaxID=74068 RepID=UPI0023E2C676|nr:uncharacterized protein LOC128998600 [Macrosteles quadrilineatus]